jgi:1-acyl-sn-glycerol-3-phosphate acyltransferase
MPMSFNLPFSVMKLYSTIWMRSRARVVVKGLEDLPPRARGEKRVYILMNHSTTFDVVALMHLSKEPFAILMDKGAFHFPIIGHILKAAGFVPLDKDNSKASVQACIDKVNGGVPLLISLHEGDSTLGEWGRPRTGGVRIAHLTGAAIYPIFLKVEEEHIRHLSFKGTNGVEYPYTTFRNTFYFVEFLKPVDLSSLPAEATYEDYFAVAKGLNEKLESVEARYDTFLSDNRERFAPLRRRGGARYRVAW